ncbi:hypothetical protein GEMRC1_000604 [Eukaryota sp. GEM-RC1]
MFHGVMPRDLIKQFLYTNLPTFISSAFQFSYHGPFYGLIVGTFANPNKTHGPECSPQLLLIKVTLNGTASPTVQYDLVNNCPESDKPAQEANRDRRLRMLTTYFTHLCNFASHIMMSLDRQELDHVVTFKDLKDHPFVCLPDEFATDNIQVVGFSSSCVTGVARNTQPLCYYKNVPGLLSGDKMLNLKLAQAAEDLMMKAIWNGKLTAFALVYSSLELGKPIEFATENCTYTLSDVISSCVRTLNEFHESRRIHLDCRLPNFVFNDDDGKLTSHLIDLELVETISDTNRHVFTQCFAHTLQAPPRLRTNSSFRHVMASIMEDYYVFLYSVCHCLYNHFRKPFPDIFFYNSLLGAIDALENDIGRDFVLLLKMLVPVELDDLDKLQPCSDEILQNFEKRVKEFLEKSSKLNSCQHIFLARIGEVKSLRRNTGVHIRYMKYSLPSV